MTLRSLLSFGSDLEGTGKLDLVRLSQSMTAVTLFTDQSKQVFLHYLKDQEIMSYVHCNETGCVLCQIKNAINEKILLPVYVLAEHRIGILPVGVSHRPQSLLPQLMGVINRHEEPVITMIIRNGNNDFTVDTRPLSEDINAGEELIKEFTPQFEAEKINISDVYCRLPNEELQPGSIRC